MRQTEYLVVVEKYGPGSYAAYVPELPARSGASTRLMQHLKRGGRIVGIKGELAHGMAILVPAMTG